LYPFDDESEVKIVQNPQRCKGKAYTHSSDGIHAHGIFINRQLLAIYSTPSIQKHMHGKSQCKPPQPKGSCTWLKA
jgi:hypothetical protein